MLLNPFRFGLPPSTLLTGLAAYWKLDEASGNAVDALGANDLTDTNAVGTASGKLGTARDFVSASSKNFAKAVAGAGLATGDIDFTISLWARPVTWPANAGLVAKWGATTAAQEFRLWYDNGGSGRVGFEVYNGTAGTKVGASNAALPINGTWFHVCCWHDSVANQIGISINNGTPNVQAWTGGLAALTSVPFWIGRENAGFWNGQIDEVGFWKRMLTAGERTSLFNSGWGKTYPFDVPDWVAPPVTGLLSGLVAYWKLDEASGDALDAQGANALTNTNAVGAATGKIAGARSFAAASSRHFVKNPAGADLTIGDNQDFTFSCWGNATSWGGSARTIVAKWGATLAAQEFRLYYSFGGSTRMALDVTNGINTATVPANNVALPATGTWFHLVCWHDATAKLIGIAINNNAAVTAGWTGGMAGLPTVPFWMGRENTGYWDGLIDEVGFWKRVLTASERTQLYNGGSGLAYPFS